MKFHGVLQNDKYAIHTCEVHSNMWCFFKVDCHALLTISMHVMILVTQEPCTLFELYLSFLGLTHLSHFRIWPCMWLAHGRIASIKTKLINISEEVTYFRGAFTSDMSSAKVISGHLPAIVVDIVVHQFFQFNKYSFLGAVVYDDEVELSSSTFAPQHCTTWVWFQRK